MGVGARLKERGGARGDADHYAMPVAVRLFLLLFCAHHADMQQDTKCQMPDNLLMTVCRIQRCISARMNAEMLTETARGRGSWEAEGRGS